MLASSYTRRLKEGKHDSITLGVDCKDMIYIPLKKRKQHLNSFMSGSADDIRRWDYTANSKFLSTQGYQNRRPGFSEGWFFLLMGETGGSHDTLSPSRRIFTLYLLSTTTGPVYGAFMSTHVRHRQRPRMRPWRRARVTVRVVCRR